MGGPHPDTARGFAEQALAVLIDELGAAARALEAARRASAPEARPSSPEARPSSPEARPSSPEARPSSPEARPSAPARRAGSGEPEASGAPGAPGAPDAVGEARAPAAVAGIASAESAALARALERVERDGWLLGWLARELGCDVLFARREHDGVAAALALVARILSREGRDGGASSACPRLARGFADDGALCAVVARAVLAARRGGLRWSFARRGATTWLEFDGPRDAALERALLDGARRLAGARVRVRAAACALALPAGAVEPG